MVTNQSDCWLSIDHVLSLIRQLRSPYGNLSIAGLSEVRTEKLRSKYLSSGMSALLSSHNKLIRNFGKLT